MGISVPYVKYSLEGFKSISPEEFLMLRNASYDELKYELSAQNAADKTRYKNDHRAKYVIGWVSPVLFILAVYITLSYDIYNLLLIGLTIASIIGMLYSSSFIFSYRSYREYLRNRKRRFLKLKRAIDDSNGYSIFMEKYASKFNMVGEDV